MHRLFLIKILIFTAFISGWSAFGSGLRSNDASAIADFINQKLQEANDHAIKSKVKLKFQYGAVDTIASKLAYYFGRKTTANVLNSPTVELLIILKEEQMPVGHMDLSFEIGIPNFFQKEQKITSRYRDNPYYVYLSFIHIKDEFRGEGYSSQALAILNDFFDRLGIDYAALLLSSKEPYAGNTYVHAGYHFIDQTIVDIKNWAATKDIANKGAVEKFLEDSSQKLPNSAPYMIRHGQKK